ncbi:MAG: hypothetical protein K2K68_11030 [Duncaniella sp.]|nr:hypothetical protein [Duncaniella sp.]MDE6582046.1 hypothetical protein [Duncaniella sp.]
MNYKLIIALIALFIASASDAQANSVKRVAILETVDKEGKVPYGIKLMVRSKLCDYITATPGYEGFDRVDVSSILSEHEFQRSGLVSDRDIKRLGEMTGATYVLVAEAAYLNSSNIFLSAKILNVETARVEQTATIQSPTTVEGLESNCKALAGKLLNINTETGALKGELNLGYAKYVGEYVNGKPHGYGIMYFLQSSDIRNFYEGNWVNGNQEGKGTMVLKDGTKYEGNWQSNVRYGFGIQYYTDGTIYEGNWINNNWNGSGIYKANNGDRIVGFFENGAANGRVTYYWSNGTHADFLYKKGKVQNQLTPTVKD